MSIKLFTGLPGAGKSLSLVDELRRMHLKEPGRPVYAFGIDGLKDGLAEKCNPREWESLPDGSIVVVDEVQKVWPSRRVGDPPRDVAAFSEHRHRGFDFLIATQNPKFIDTYLRGLVEQHTHVVRRWGAKTVDRYVWQEGQEDVKSRAVRASGQRQRWKYPRECFDLYKSSTMHTVRRRLPWQYWVMIAAGVLAVPVIFFAVHRVLGLRHMAKDVVPGSSASVDRSGGLLAPMRSEKVRWATPEQYIHDHIPRVASQPWSAPIFDGEAVQAHPDLMCITYHRIVSGTDQELCSCFTEQVTPYQLHDAELCRRIARDGVYNPRRPPLGGRVYASRRLGARSAASKSVTQGSSSGSVSPDGWQPAWRTRSYVQPEKSRVTSLPSRSPSGGG